MGIKSLIGILSAAIAILLILSLSMIGLYSNASMKGAVLAQEYKKLEEEYDALKTLLTEGILKDTLVVEQPACTKASELLYVCYRAITKKEISETELRELKDYMTNEHEIPISIRPGIRGDLQ